MTYATTVRRCWPRCARCGSEVSPYMHAHGFCETCEDYQVRHGETTPRTDAAPGDRSAARPHARP